MASTPYWKRQAIKVQMACGKSYQLAGRAFMGSRKDKITLDEEVQILDALVHADTMIGKLIKRIEEKNG